MPMNAASVISRLASPLWPATVVGILAGSVIGGLLLHGTTEYQATSIMRVYQPIDPDQIMTGAAPSPDSQQDYVSGEITYLTSTGFGNALADRLDETHPPQVSAVQDAHSSLIRLTATQPDLPEAKRIVYAALDVYREHAVRQARDRGQAALDALNEVVAMVEAEAAAAAAEAADAGLADTPPAPDGQQIRLQQLDQQRLAIEAQLRRPAAVQVVQQPLQTPIEGVPGWQLGAVGGGLVGGLLGLAGALGWRTRAGVITSRSDIEHLIEQVLVPTVPLRSLSASSDGYMGLARALYAQLPAPRSGRILVFGASAESGAATVAKLLTAAIAEHSSVRFVSPEQLADNLTNDETVVIDGGSIASSPQLTDVVDGVDQVVIVVMIGRDMHDAVRTATQFVRGAGTPVSAVCTRRGTPKPIAMWRNHNESKLAPETSANSGDGLPRRARHSLGTGNGRPAPDTEPEHDMVRPESIKA